MIGRSLSDTPLRGTIRGATGRPLRVMVALDVAPPPRGWLSIGKTVALLLAAIAVMQGAIALGAALRTLTQGVPFEEALRRVTSEPLGPALAQLLGLGMVLLVGMRVTYGPDASVRESLQVRAVPASIALLSLIAGLALQFPLVEVTSVLSDMVPAIAFDEEERRHVEEMTRMGTPLRAIATPIAIVLIAPVSEELVFRGLLLPALTPRLSAPGALLITSVLFGVFHLHPLVAGYATIAGLVLGAVALRTGSVLPAIALHAGVNAVPLLLPERLAPIRGFNVAESDHLPLPIVAATTAVAAIALGLVWRLTAPSGPSSGEPPDDRPSAPPPGPPSDDPRA